MTKVVPSSLAGEEPTSLEAPTSPLYAAGLVRLLVIDDDLYVGNMIQKVFAGQDFTVDVVSDPEQVESVLRSGNYHLVILDYVLPGLAYNQVTDWIRQYQVGASVIVVTGYPSLDSAVNCLRAQIDDYIAKPFGIDQLRQTVMRCLERNGLLRLSEEALREQVGTAIRERRKALNLTLAELAERTGVSLGYLSQIELGRNSPSLEMLYRIALGLRVRMADFFEAVQVKS